ncbi:MAG TPA: DUF4397 domain-containing protein [Terriglobales bacterium]|nr:DUF4397 domain-containing protein [Terriglobales bacterium]
MLSRVMRFGVGLLCSAATLSAIGCGGGGSAKFRVLQAVPNEPNLNVLIDSTSINSALAFEADTGYQTEKSGSHQFAMEQPGSTTNIVPSGNQTLNLTSNSQNTFILTGYSSSISGMLLSDDTTAPTNSEINLRIVNAAASLGTTAPGDEVDVYVVASGTALSGTPTVSALAFNSASDYQSIAAGTYQIYFTEPGTTLTYYSTPPITFTAGQNRTVVFLSPLGFFTTTTLNDLN